MEQEQKKKIKVYISLPISGYDLEERKETAMRMEIKLRGCGYEVCNPLGNGWQAGLTTYEYMRRDIEMLMSCNTVIFMKGFNRSAGCHTEFCVATACGLDVWFEESATEIIDNKIYLQNGRNC